MLALLDYSKEFFIEIDASGVGLGVVLSQQKHLTAYISRMLNSREHKLSVYERDLLAIVYAVHKWHSHLVQSNLSLRLTITLNSCHLIIG